MDIAKLKKIFFGLVPSHPPNNWEIEEHLEGIVDLPAELQELILAQVPSIWSVAGRLFRWNAARARLSTTSAN